MNGQSWIRVFLGEFSDPFLRLLLFAAVLSGGVGVVRGDLSEATGIVITTALTALAATFNRLRTNREFMDGTGLSHSGPAQEERSSPVRGGLIERLERLVAIIGVIAAGVALFTLVFLVARAIGSATTAFPWQEWLFAGIIFAGALFFTWRLWLYLLYQTAAAAGAELVPDDLFASPGLRSWKTDLFLSLAGSGSLLVLGLLSGMIPLDPRSWFSWPTFLELQHIVLITISIIVITVPDGLGMSVALALRLGIGRLHAHGVRVRDPHSCEWFGMISLFLVDQALLSLLPASEFERIRRRLRAIGVGMFPVFTSDRSLRLVSGSEESHTRPGRKLVRPTVGPGGTRLELPYLNELDGFVVDRFEADLAPLVRELETRGENVAWVRPAESSPGFTEVSLVADMAAHGNEPRVPIALARFRAPGLEHLAEMVMQGRAINAGIRRFLVFQLPVNLAGMLFEIAGLIMGWHLPLSLPQVLWINLVMDVFAPWALAGEPVGGGEAARVERTRDEGGRMLVTAGMFEEILWVGLTMFLLAVGFLLAFGGKGTTLPPEAGAIFFALFLAMQCWNLLLARFYGTEGPLTAQPLPGRRFRWSLGLLVLTSVIVVQFGGSLLQSMPLPLVTWVAILAFPSLLVIVAELRRRGILPGA